MSRESTALASSNFQCKQKYSGEGETFLLAVVLFERVERGRKLSQEFRQVRLINTGRFSKYANVYFQRSILDPNRR